MVEHGVPKMGEHKVPKMGEHGVSKWVSTEYLMAAFASRVPDTISITKPANRIPMSRQRPTTILYESTPGRMYLRAGVRVPPSIGMDKFESKGGLEYLGQGVRVPGTGG